MRTRHKTNYPGIYYRETEGGQRRYIVWYSDANGVGHTQTLPLEANLEAARLLQGKLQARKASGETLVRTRKTVGELLDEWHSGLQHVRPKTRENYAWAIGVHLKPVLGQRKVAELSASDVARLISKLKGEGKKTWTVKKILSPLNGAYRLAVRDGLVSSNPCDRLLPSERPKGDQKEMRCLSREELTSLLSSASSLRWRTLFALLAFSGLRISEALGLTWDNVTEDRVIVCRGKTKAAEREVILIPSVRRLLTALRLEQPPGTSMVFVTSVGTPVVPRDALRALKTAEKKAKLPSYTLHELRHTFASILIAQGEPPTLVAKQMGHADPGVTMKTYAHLFEAQASVDQARDRLQAAMGGVV